MVRRLVLTAACIDVGYIALFVWLGSWPLTLVNVGIALYLAAYALIRHRKNAWGLALIWLEVAAHTALGSLLIGWESGFHYYLLLFVPAIVVANAWLRGAVGGGAAGLLPGAVGAVQSPGPAGTLAGKGLQIVNWIHICIAFALSAALAGHLPAHHRDCRTQAAQDGDAGRPDRPVQPQPFSEPGPARAGSVRAYPGARGPCCCAISTTSNR